VLAGNLRDEGYETLVAATVRRTAFLAKRNPNWLSWTYRSRVSGLRTARRTGPHSAKLRSSRVLGVELKTGAIMPTLSPASFLLRVEKYAPATGCGVTGHWLNQTTLFLHGTGWVNFNG